MPVGPRGEKRPVSPVSSMVKAMSIATGIDEEEYVDGASRKPKRSSKPSNDDELEDEVSIAALEVDKPGKRKKRKKRPSKT